MVSFHSGEGDLHAETHRETIPHEDGGEMGMVQLQAKGHQTMLAVTRSQDKVRNILP